MLSGVDLLLQSTTLRVNYSLRWRSQLSAVSAWRRISGQLDPAADGEWRRSDRFETASPVSITGGAITPTFARDCPRGQTGNCDVPRVLKDYKPRMASQLKENKRTARGERKPNSERERSA